MSHPFRPLYVEVVAEPKRRRPVTLDLTYLLKRYYPFALPPIAHQAPRSSMYET